MRRPSRRNRSRSLVLAAIAALLHGCLAASFVDGTEIPDARVAMIEPGVTTKGQILEWFGAPSSFSDTAVLERIISGALSFDLVEGFSQESMLPEEVVSLPFADALVFRLVRAKLDGRFYVVYVSADVRIATDSLVVFFDEADRVKYFGYSRDADALQ